MFWLQNHSGGKSRRVGRKGHARSGCKEGASVDGGISARAPNVARTRERIAAQYTQDLDGPHRGGGGARRPWPTRYGVGVPPEAREWGLNEPAPPGAIMNVRDGIVIIVGGGTVCVPRPPRPPPPPAPAPTAPPPPPPDACAPPPVRPSGGDALGGRGTAPDARPRS